MEFERPETWEIRGRVHCNSDIYIQTFRDLTFDTNYLRAAGGIYGRGPWASWELTGLTAPRIRRWVPDPFDPSEIVEYEDLWTKEDLAAQSVTSTGGMDSDFAGHDINGDGNFTGVGEYQPFLGTTLDLFAPPSGYVGATTGTTVQTAAHGVTRLMSPELSEFDMFVTSTTGDFVLNGGTGEYDPVAPGTGTHERGDFHANADLTILSHPGGTWTAYDSLGNDVSSTLSAVIGSDTMFDGRQAEGNGQSIQMTTIDVAALNASGLFPQNGLLYVAGYGAGTGTDVKGFQLTNGAQLQGPLNVVSPDSVYVHGDYNTVSTQPAAVMADAVNLLSNAWDNSKGPGQLPAASATTYNVSIVAGDVASTEPNMSGGPHNLPRRHEDWSGVDEHLNGSIVCPYRSERATGLFVIGGEHYTPPNRFWSYDESLNSLANLPPFTPVVVEIDDAAIWSARP